MGRFLFLLALVVFVIWLYKSWQRTRNSRNHTHAPHNRSASHQEGGNIQLCLHCGAYSPIEIGVMIEGRFYCSLEHAKLKGEG